jgi:hypothetical protein
MQQRLVLLLGAGLALASPARPTITAAPDVGLSRRQEGDGPGFFGYARVGDSWSAETCGQSMFFVSSSSYGACLPGTTVTNNIPKTCLEGSIIDYPVGKATCSGVSNACMTILIHSDLGDEAPTSMIFCHSTATEHSVYVKTTGSVPSSRSTTSSNDKSTSSSESTEPPPAPTEDPATETETSSRTSRTDAPPTSSSEPSDTGAPKNMAWVAGPVVGGVAGIAIIGLLVWIIILLRKRQHNKSHEGASTTGLHAPDMPKDGHSMELQYQHESTGTSTYKEPVEISTYKEPVEMSTYKEPAELHPQSFRPELYSPPTRQELQG